MSIALTELPKGSRARIVTIDGGKIVVSRLSAMGVTPGRDIRKVSALAAGGPQVIEIDRAQVAIGRGMAEKIFVESSEPDDRVNRDGKPPRH